MTTSHFCSPHPPGLAAELELREHFQKKRDGRRCDFKSAVWIRGRAGRFTATTVNASRRGILVEITDPIFCRFSLDYLWSYAERIRHHFGTGADFCFENRRTKIRGSVVRVEQRVPGTDGTNLMAMKFRRRLSPDQCLALGIDYGDDTAVAIL